MLLCLMVEIIVVLVLLVIIGWDYGVEDWLKEVTTPVVKELDVGGVNSSHVVLMSANGGKVIGEINGEEQIYPASLTKIMTVIVAIEELDDLEEKIMLDADIFPELYAGDATQAGFQAGEAVRQVQDLHVPLRLCA